jgi:hypothetical protein
MFTGSTTSSVKPSSPISNPFAKAPNPGQESERFVAPLTPENASLKGCGCHSRKSSSGGAAKEIPRKPI